MAVGDALSTARTLLEPARWAKLLVDDVVEDKEFFESILGRATWSEGW